MFVLILVEFGVILSLKFGVGFVFLRVFSIFNWLFDIVCLLVYRLVLLVVINNFFIFEGVSFGFSDYINVVVLVMWGVVIDVFE